MANIIEQLDHQIATLLSDWSLITTLLTLALVAFAAYPILYPNEPDTHPLLLSRQSAASPVRNKHESAVYRSPETPHGYPLKTGLNVKDAGAPRWAMGRDGDLRDVWREVLKGGSVGEDGKPVSKGDIVTVYGREQVMEHEVEQMSREIIVLGRHWKNVGLKRVAIYLPNSVEFLETIFACAFYGLSPVLLPYNLPHPKVFELLNTTGADGLVCAAGSLPLEDVADQCKALRLLTWMVEHTSRHMDWNGVPEGAQDRLTVSVWHDVVENNHTTTLELPSNEQGDKPANLVSVWQPADLVGKPDIVTFTHSNLVSATSALLSALPLRQRLTSTDLLLPADSFTHTYVLCQTLAALYTHAGLAINSVASAGVDLAAAMRGTSPTVVIASAETMATLHAKETAGITSAVQRVGKYARGQALTAGRMPTDNFVSRIFFTPSSSASGNATEKLRLILTSERLGAGSPSLTSTMLSDLRIFTHARICYALTTSRVAGAVAQTNVFDYRSDGGAKTSHFGTPLSSVEVKLASGDDGDVDGSGPRGEIYVTGPAVSGGEVRLGVRGRFRGDATLAYVD